MYIVLILKKKKKTLKKVDYNVTLFTMSKYFQRQFINGGKKVAVL